MDSKTYYKRNQVKVDLATLPIHLKQDYSGCEIIFPREVYKEIDIPANWSGTTDKPTIVRSENVLDSTVVGIWHGIGFDKKCHNIVLDGFNIISTCYGTGIVARGDYITLRRCRIAQSGNHAIHHGDNASAPNLTIDGCWIHDCGTNRQHHQGIYITSPNLTVRRSRIERCSANGISVIVNNSCLVEDCTITDCGNCGIWARILNSGKGLTIRNTTVVNNGDAYTGCQLSLYGGSSIERIFLENSIFCGRNPVYREGDNLAYNTEIAPCWFGELGSNPGFEFPPHDYRLKTDNVVKGKGFPEKYWASTKEDWDDKKYPYTRSPWVPVKSLLPDIGDYED